MKNLFPFLSVLFIAFSCSNDPTILIVPGVSEEIAQFRKENYINVEYDLHLNISADKDDPIPGNISIRFDHLGKPNHDLILDFNIDSTLASEVKLSNSTNGILWKNEHILIDKSLLKEGQNEFVLDFIAGDLSLNRNEDYLYTLFVPDRASTAFPCFDQPDLKARFTLSLEIPEHWVAVTNYSQVNSTSNNGRKTIEFNQTQPLPTYLFAFAVGEFKVANSVNTTRPMTMYYRETDSIKVSKNLDEIFNLHQKSLDWLEEYTGIDYPFEKFDFALIPPFQYGGMEHPGAIFYRERSLFLDESATLNDSLGRASLIAHETAHIWFGDLVTMKWFNDVWAKEVFANFMADKIVNPSFPSINHELKFLLRHYPSSYAVDRTAGANAIRQKLSNLKNAGLMYGPIIYNKAPAMMKHLEKLTGETAFREGMREYLSTYSFDNADWNDLIYILDAKVEDDFTSWSKIWIEEPGMPVYNVKADQDNIQIQQRDPLGQNRSWMQRLVVMTNNESKDILNTETGQNIDVTGSYEYIILNGMVRNREAFYWMSLVWITFFQTCIQSMMNT